MKSVLGVIGGSGLYDLPGLTDVQTLSIDSPWGDTSAPLLRGRIGTTDLVFLPRHGEGHHIPPSEINYRANIDALKRAGVTDLISLSACGSFRENLPPGTFVLVDQFLDFTRNRESSFFERGCVAHVSMADPVSPHLVMCLNDAAIACGIACHMGGTYLAMEGPQFSTRAESRFFREIGADVIGMTAMPEAKLAREAEISYALVAMVTDFDCWQDNMTYVEAKDVLDVMHDNTQKAQILLTKFAETFPKDHIPCKVGSDHALEHAIVTDLAQRDPILLRKLDAILSRISKAEL